MKMLVLILLFIVPGLIAEERNPANNHPFFKRFLGKWEYTFHFDQMNRSMYVNRTISALDGHRFNLFIVDSNIVYVRDSLDNYIDSSYFVRINAMRKDYGHNYEYLSDVLSHNSFLIYHANDSNISNYNLSFVNDYEQPQNFISFDLLDSNRMIILESDYEYNDYGHNDTTIWHRIK